MVLQHGAHVRMESEPASSMRLRLLKMMVRPVLGRKRKAMLNFAKTRPAGINIVTVNGSRGHAGLTGEHSGNIARPKTNRAQGANAQKSQSFSPLARARIAWAPSRKVALVTSGL
jgi:hypothetical protein